MYQDTFHEKTYQTHSHYGYIMTRGSGRGGGFHGGGGGGGGGCFVGSTLVRMKDGSYQRIDKLVIGDETAGGRVLATMAFDAAAAAPLVRIGGVVVTADHAVLDTERGAFVRAHCASGAVALGPCRERVYDVVTSGHRIVTLGGRVFADFQEVDYAKHPKVKADVYDDFLRVLNTSNSSRVAARQSLQQ